MPTSSTASGRRRCSMGSPASPRDRELWVTDGTAIRTKVLKDMTCEEVGHHGVGLFRLPVAVRESSSVSRRRPRSRRSRALRSIARSTSWSLFQADDRVAMPSAAASASPASMALARLSGPRTRGMPASVIECWSRTTSMLITLMPAPAPSGWRDHRLRVGWRDHDHVVLLGDEVLDRVDLRAGRARTSWPAMTATRRVSAPSLWRTDGTSAATTSLARDFIRTGPWHRPS